RVFTTMSTKAVLAFAAVLSAACVAAAQSQERPATNEPQFVSRGGKRVVKEGEDIDLDCEVHDLGEFVILWKFNKTQVLFAGNLRIHRDDRISRDDQKGSLRVKQFRPENAGEYSCQISTNPPKDIVYNVAVIGPPQIRAFPSQPLIAVQKNDSFALRCDAADVQRVEWRRTKVSAIATTLPLILMPFPQEDRVLAVGHEFVRERALPADTDVYECSAVNAIGQSSHAFKVQVLHEPEVRAVAARVHAPIGQRAHITCSISSEPSASVFWKKGNEKLNSNSDYRFETRNNATILFIKSVSREHYDNYTCFANNSLGAASAVVDVSGRPSAPRFTSAAVGGAHTRYLLEWSLESQSPISSYDLTFRRVDVADVWRTIQVQPSAQTTTDGVVERKETYLLENLTQDGNYEVTLAAHNEFGATTSHVFAFVTSAAAQHSSLFIAFIAIVIWCAFH
ncbi:unnamed protein product, partial [Medioppia subpectinata]